MPSPSLPVRMRKMQQRLLDIRLGPGALMLPKDVKRVHLQFAPKINGGHQGPRKFWRNELVQLKYHNPAIPMTIDRSVAQTENAILSVHYTAKDAPQTSDTATSSPAAINSTTQTSKPSDAAPTERVETIDMTHKTNNEILQAFVRLTKARQVEPTAADLEEIHTLKEQQARSAYDSKLGHELKARQAHEKALLEQARGQLGP